jgi:hypothetical protein
MEYRQTGKRRSEGGIMNNTCPVIDSQKIFDTWYRYLQEASEGVVNDALALPDSLIIELGKTINHSRTPMSIITAILEREARLNILKPFLTVAKGMLREFHDSDYYLLKTMFQIEFLSNQIGGFIIKAYKGLDP